MSGLENSGRQRGRLAMIMLLSGAIGAAVLTPQRAVAAPLAAPSSVTAVAVSSSAIDVRWVDPNSDESGYEVWHSLNGSDFSLLATTGPNAVSHRHSGLGAGTTHFYRVRATRLGNGSKVFVSSFAPDPGSVSATTLAATTTTSSTTISSSTTTTTLGGGDTTPPSVPTGLAATVASCSQVNLSWNASTDASGIAAYRVYTWQNSQWQFLRQVSGRSTAVTGLAASTTYYYNVSAVDVAGNESAQSGWVSAVTSACGGTTTTTTLQSGDTTPPSVPTGLAATVASCSQVNLSWNASTDASGIAAYRVYTWQNSQWQFLRQVSGTSTAVTGLAASTTYYYNVSAVDVPGNESAQSGWVSAATSACGGTTTTTLQTGDTTPPSVPTGVGATAWTCDTVVVAWGVSTDTGGSGLRGYRVYGWRNSQTTFLQEVLAPTTAFGEGGLSASTTYWYKVAGIDNAGNESALSGWASATTPACGGTTSTSVTTTTTSSTTTTMVGTVAPGLVGYVPGVGTARGVTVVGTKAYVASQEFGLTRIGVGTPSASAVEQSADEPFAGQHVAVAGGRAIVLTAGTAGTIELTVLTNLGSVPTVVGRVVTGIPASQTNLEGDVVLNSAGTLAVAALGTGDVWVVDVSVPSNPQVRATYATPGVPRGVALNASGTVAYVADGTAGLTVLGLGNPNNPTLLGQMSLTGRNYRDVVVSGSVVYLVNQSGTLDVVDVSVASNPQLVAWRTLSGVGLQVALEGTTAVVLTANGGSKVDVVNVAVPTAPQVTRTITLANGALGQGVALANGLIFVAADADGLHIYDVTSTAAPVIVPVFGAALDVAVQGGYAYVADDAAVMTIIGW